jgi:hypothetical protein
VKRKWWFLAANPSKPDSELARLAGTRTSYDDMAVGVWFATTDVYKAGMYWVVVHPEHSEAHEVFWGHFYLTDDLEYQTPFDKQ